MRPIGDSPSFRPSISRYKRPPTGKNNIFIYTHTHTHTMKLNCVFLSCQKFFPKVSSSVDRILAQTCSTFECLFAVLLLFVYYWVDQQDCKTENFKSWDCCCFCIPEKVFLSTPSRRGEQFVFFLFLHLYSSLKTIGWLKVRRIKFFQLVFPHQGRLGPAQSVMTHNH